MNAGKFLAALIISAVMVVSACLCMGSFSVQAAVSEQSIEMALEQSGAVDEIKSAVPIDRISAVDQNLGQAAENALNSQQVNDFIAGYLAAAIQAQLNGQEIEGVSEEDLTAILYAAIDDEVESGNLGISKGQAKMIKGAMVYVMPELTRQLNDTLDQYTDAAITDDARRAMDILSFVTGPLFRYGTLAIAFLCALLLMLMFWESRLGLLWAAFNMFVSSALFILASKVLKGDGTVDASASIVKRMIVAMVSNGTTFAAVIGIIIGVLMIVLCVIMRLSSRKARRAYR